ncbi:MAG: PAS domain-containing protein [Ilumatobacteraceae bacterium]
MSDRMLSLVLDYTTDAILVSDSDGRIVYANTPLLRLFRFPSKELIGQPFEILMNQSDDLDVEGRRKDGFLFPVDVQLSALPDSALVVAVVRDMTAQRRTVVDIAIAKIDLDNANSRIEHLQASLDLVIQRLFALGTSIVASARQEMLLSQRMDAAVQGIDEVIEAVQNSRQPIAGT